MNYVPTDYTKTVSESQSPATKSKTALDVAFFYTFLGDIKGIKNRKLEEFTETELTLYMCEFFSGVKKKTNGDDYEPTSLWAIYASLKRYLKEKDFPFSESPPLTKVTEVLKAVCKGLKKKGKGSLPNKSDAVTSQEINMLYETGMAGFHNPRALNNALAVTCMFLGFRGGRELYCRCLGDFKVVTADGIRYLTVTKERVTKTRNGETPRDLRFGEPRLAEIPGSKMCPVKVFETIHLYRPTNFTDENSPLFLRPFALDPVKPYTQNKTWYFKQRIGIHEICKIVKKMCVPSDIDFSGRKITNTSMRKAVATTLLKNKCSTKTIMRQLGHTNPQSLIRYDDTTNEEIVEVTNTLFGQAGKADGKEKTGVHFDVGINNLLKGTCVQPNDGEPGPSRLNTGSTVKIFNIQF